ncbi:MAG TPA: protease pro-enzyme activation domain-containing protein, partial [Fimbriimonadaceae bacterium]|nr:protease pro-enzyme activation domain-containing protein [Fimbriimonadaceae bacterium]
MLLRSAFVVASSLAFAVASFGKQGSTTWVPLPMRTPPSVQSALLDGEKNPGDVVHLSIAIPYRDPIGMQKFVDSVSDPKSPTYRHFITPDEVGSRFGMPQADVQAVADYLTSQGISVKLVAKNRLSILADATVAQAEAAFHTSIKNYIVASDGTSPSKERFCFTTAPSVPASIRSYVTYVEGLENFTQPKAAYESPSQLRTLYSLAPIYNSGNTGSGRTVAISNWDGYRLSNIPLEYAQFGLATPPGGAGSNVTVVSINGSDGNTYPPGAEGDIDIQCTLAMAPLCNFIIYDDAGDGDYLGVLTREANDNSADFISESWGWSSDPSLFAATHNVHLSMSAQGITYMCASGDSGTDWPISWCYPDEDPEVMTVGGTTVSTTGVGV